MPLRLDVDLAQDPKNQAAKDGDGVHLLSEKYVRGTPISVGEACKATGGKQDRVALLWENLIPWLDTLEPFSSWAAEAFYLYNPRTDRCRVSSRDDKDRDEWEVPAIADLATQDGPNHATVWDIKTGNPSYVKESQLHTLAVAASRWFGVQHVAAGFLFVDERSTHEELRHFDDAKIDRHASYLESLLIYLPDATPKPCASCRWCLVKACPDGDAHRAHMGWRKKK